MFVAKEIYLSYFLSIFFQLLENFKRKCAMHSAVAKDRP
jgi:hypothetical protein